MAASSGGLDGTGYTYSADALPANFSWAGIPFLPNAIDMSNAVSSGIMIAPSGSFTSLRLLGTAPGGDQTAQPFTVTTSTVNLSDWCARSPASGETQIVYSFYRDIGLENSVVRLSPYSATWSRSTPRARPSRRSCRTIETS